MALNSDAEKKIGLRIANIRKSKSISQIHLAEVCNMNFNYISKIELGKANFTINILKKIADGLDVSISDFFRFEN